MDLIPLFIFIFATAALGIILVLISEFLGNKITKKRVNDIYESGVDPVGMASTQYDIKFFLTAILFLLFDVEIVFLIPWVLSFSDTDFQSFYLIELAFFLAILVAGYCFVALSGSLNWED